MNNEKRIDLEPKLISYDGEDKIISSYDMKAHIALHSSKTINIKSGLHSLDDLLGGFEAGELNVISGCTGHGKTLFATSLTRHFSTAGVDSVWFSFEMMPSQFLRSFGETLPLFYIPQRLQMNSTDWIEQRILEAKLKHDCRAVFIDHLHFLVDMKSRNNMSLEIGSVMRLLKTMAIDLNVCVFLIAHTAKTRMDTEIDIDALRDSSFVGQEADNVMMIKRLVDTENQAVLKIVKNRKNGYYGKVNLLRMDGVFVEMANE